LLTRRRGDEMQKYYVSVKNKEGGYKTYSVPQEVYIYILQLEAYIRNPTKSKLKEVYNDSNKKEGG